MAVTGTTSVARRRVFYGTNVGLQIIIAVVVVVAAVYFAQGWLKGQADLTRSGTNSLTPRTRQLLKGLDQPVRVTALYTVLSKYDTLAQKRQNMMRDLLALYEAGGGGKVTAELVDPMADTGRIRAVVERLKGLKAYLDEAQAHQAALADFKTLADRLRETLTAQQDELKRELQARPDQRATPLSDINREVERLVRTAAATEEDVQAALSGDLPAYGRAVESARSFVQAFTSYVKVFSDWAKDAARPERGVDAETLAVAQRFDTGYRGVLPDADAWLDRTKDLKRLKLEELGDTLSRWATAPVVLVETAERAEVLSYQDVWPFRMDANAPLPPDGDQREFAGEQALSSAILKLTQKDKTAVIFTRYGGPSPITPDFSNVNLNMRQLPRAPYGQLNELLGKQNFLTEDWDVQTEKTPPTVEGATRTVYVVFPPAPPPQPDPRRPVPPQSITPEDVKIITDAVAGAAGAVFLAGWSEPPGPFAPPTPFAFADYLRNTWGIDPLTDFVTLHFLPTPDGNLYFPPRNTLLLDTGRARLTDHEITRPLQSTPGGFERVCPLKPVTSLPAGVQHFPLVEVKPSNDVWAVKDIMRLQEDLRSRQGTQRMADDVAPPFPIALAAVDGQGRRLVAFGSVGFASDDLLAARTLMLVGSALAAVELYPANADLFLNALHWITNDASRISVGVRGSDVPRLSKLQDDAWLRFWRIFMVGIWPALALVIGGGVWLFRRR